jgi:dihydrofolate synthase/folylpolyglutamate synthase
MARPDVEAFLKQLDPLRIRPGLQRIRRLMEVLDHPEAHLEAILVAGTNGKGSVAECLSSILVACGTKVATYTSPHLHHLEERIRLDGKPISKRALVRHFRRVKNAANKVGDVSYFEFITALALDFFRRASPDWAVLEVGLGGRWDAVNVVDPQLCILTPVGLDHTDILGSTITAIADEKAAIIRPGRPVVCGRQTSSALRIIEARCHDNKAPLSVIGRAFRLRQGESTEEGQHFTYIEAGLTVENLYLPLLGAHQAENAACAVRAYRLLCEQGRVAWSEEGLRQGLASVNLKGRLQIVSRRPLVVVDGAHNEHAARVLVRSVKELWPQRPLTLIFGTLEDKDYLRISRVLFPMANQVVLVPVASFPERSADPKVVAARTAGQAKELLVAPDLATAVETSLASLPGDGVCLITGSLYLAGEAIAYFDGE